MLWERPTWNRLFLWSDRKSWIKPAQKTFDLPTVTDPSHAQLLLDNYRRCFAEDLVPRGKNEAQRLMDAPFVVLSHGTQQDPVFNYGNATAQRLFEMDWATLTALPSRYSAEPMHRDERQQLLDEVATQGYSDNYRGIRISATGQRFYIDSARIWMLLDSEGKHVGQAATFSDWEMLK